MSDNIEDNDDFDIYADLEDNNDKNFDINNDLIDFNLSQTQSNCFENNSNNNNNNNNNNENDLILSELTILEKSLAKTEFNNKDLLKQNQELRQELVKKDKQLSVLKTNISSLYKTAKAEIERKKREINELREEYDSLVFKRFTNKSINSNNNSNSNSNCFSNQLNTGLNRVSDEKVDKTSDELSAKKFCNKSTNTSDSDFNYSFNQKVYTIISFILLYF
jgi:hypothetical protein